tara:strand:- start:19 stop:771 length:753 start_codon:yes stop_codon:yes gene_type:complete
MPRIIKPASGSFTTADITVDSSGRIIAASTGAAGGGNMVRTFQKHDDGTATFTAQSTSTKIHVYLRGAGGGGGAGNGGEPGKTGGFGGFGFFNIPISQPYSVPYTLGAGGAGGPYHQAGSAGTASSFNTNLVANAGNGGQKNGQAAGNPGTLQNESYAYIDGNPFAESNDVLFVPEGMSHKGSDDGYQTLFGSFYNNIYQKAAPGDQRSTYGGLGGAAGAGPQAGQGGAGFSTGGKNGKDGSLVVYEDIG